MWLDHLLDIRTAGTPVPPKPTGWRMALKVSAYAVAVIAAVMLGVFVTSVTLYIAHLFGL